MKINVNVNGQDRSEEVEPRTLLVDFIRETLKLTGTHVGCDTTQCGACTVHLDGIAIKSCTILAVQANNQNVTTIEGISKNDGLHPMQQSFKENHGLQCGFCTPGFVMSLFALYKTNLHPTRQEIDDALAGNLCRCTGYRPIVDAANKMYEDLVEDQNWTRLPAGSRKGEDEEMCERADGRAGEARAGRGRAERGRGARERLRGEGEGAHRVSAFGTGR